MTYYYIKSKKMFAKSNSFLDNYLYKNGEWVKDDEFIVSDRIIGYEPDEDPYYGIGNIDITEDLEEITEEEFEKRCNQATPQKSDGTINNNCNRAIDWKNANLSDAELRELVWKAGSPTVQGPFSQAIRAHLGRDIWDMQKFKDDVRAYLINEKKLSVSKANRRMAKYDKDMHDFMYKGLSMEAIASAMGV